MESPKSSKTYRNRKRRFVWLGYLAICIASVALILGGLIKMALCAPTAALIAMAGVTALSLVRHDIALTLQADAQKDRQERR